MARQVCTRDKGDLVDEVKSPSYHFLFLSILSWAGVVGDTYYLSVFPTAPHLCQSDLLCVCHVAFQFVL